MGMKGRRKSSRNVARAILVSRGPQMVQRMSNNLYQRWTSEVALASAWKRVRRNKGMAGGDGQTLAQFGYEADARIAALSSQLRTHYRAGPIKRLATRKPSGGTRVLAIPSVRDRVAQAACAEALDTILDPLMSDASFAYRRGRSVEHAAGLVMTWRLRGYTWALDGDIRRYFDRILQEKLIERLIRDILCRRTAAIVRLWLRGWSPRGRGVAQGSPLSPLLANLYLTDLDHLIEGKRSRLVRYADDFLVLTRSREDAMRARRKMADELAALGLELHPEKTSIRRIEDGLEFLGVRFAGMVG